MAVEALDRYRALQLLEHDLAGAAYDDWPRWSSGRVIGFRWLERSEVVAPDSRIIAEVGNEPDATLVFLTMRLCRSSNDLLMRRASVADEPQRV